jgi:hypothetical protein
MELWILGELLDKGSGKEASRWNLYGIFLSREEAFRGYCCMHAISPEPFFILPAKAGELLSKEVTKMPGFELVVNSLDEFIC